MDTVTQFLIERIEQISYVLSSIVMMFVSDLIMGRILLKRLKKADFFSRTVVFVLYAVLALPAMMTLGAYLLRTLVLDPFKESILLVLAISFVIVGVLLSVRYGMKLK